MAVVALGVAGVAMAVVPDDDGTLHLCAGENGALRVRDPEAEERCAEGESELTINRGLTWRGPWSDGTSYEPGDAVQVEGSSFVAVLSSTGVFPEDGSKEWGLLAAAGAQGPQGPQGPTGPKGAVGEPSVLSPLGYSLRPLGGTFAPTGSIRSVVRGDGRPFVAYADQGRLSTLSCDTTCSNNARSTIEAANVGTGEIDVVLGPTGMPWVSYALTSGALRVAQCTNSNCTQWTIRDLLAGASSQDTAMLVGAAATPLVAVSSSGALTLYRCDSNSCTSLIEPVNLGGGTLPRLAKQVNGLPRVLFASGTTIRWSRCSGTPVTCTTLNAGIMPNAITGLDLRTGPSGQLAAVVASSTSAHLRACGNDCASSGARVEIPVGAVAPPDRVSVLWSAKGTPSAAVGVVVSTSPQRSVLRVVGCGDALCTHGSGAMDVALNALNPGASLVLGSDGVPIGFVRTSHKQLLLLR